jgi:hypothetical protein
MVDAGVTTTISIELFTIGLLIFIIIYILIRLLSERREHALFDKKEKKDEDKPQ